MRPVKPVQSISCWAVLAEYHGLSVAYTVCTPTFYAFTFFGPHPVRWPSCTASRCCWPVILPDAWPLEGVQALAQDIGDIVMGSVLGDSSQRAIQVRIAGLLAGIPDNVPVHTVNRWACL